LTVSSPWCLQNLEISGARQKIIVILTDKYNRTALPPAERHLILSAEMGAEAQKKAFESWRFDQAAEVSECQLDKSVRLLFISHPHEVRQPQ
jgi:hypothetical protein